MDVRFPVVASLLAPPLALALAFAQLADERHYAISHSEICHEDSAVVKEACCSKLEQASEMTLNDMKVTGLFLLRAQCSA